MNVDVVGRPKRKAHDLNRGPCQTTTEFREKYRNRGGRKADEIRNPDNLKNGPRFYKDTAYGQHYLTTKGDKKVKESWGYDKDMHGKIKEYGRGRFPHADKNHPDRKVGPRAPADLTLKPSGFEKDKWYGDNIPINNRNTTRSHYGGHYDGLAKRMDKGHHKDHTYAKINTPGYTTTGRHHVAKAPQRELDRGCNDMNKAYDRTTEQLKPNAKVNKITTQREHHHPLNGKIDNKIHTGQDYIANKELGQLMGGFYYDEA